MDFNRRMRSWNVQGFASKVLTLYEEEVRRRRIRKRLYSAVRLYAHAQFHFYIVFLCNGIHNIPLLSAVTKKRVSVPEAHKISTGWIGKYILVISNKIPNYPALHFLHTTTNKFGERHISLVCRILITSMLFLVIVSTNPCQVNWVFYSQ